MTSMATGPDSISPSWVMVSVVGGLAVGLLLRANHGLARALAGLEVRMLNVETTVDTHGAQLGDVCFMSEHNAKVLGVLCERAGWSIEHVRQLPALRQGMRREASAEAPGHVV